MPHIVGLSGALVTVVETAAYLAEATRILTDDERMDVVNMLAADPTCGDLVSGGGGIRKVRIPVGNRGKRGGARVIYYHHSGRLPVFLLALFGKNQKSDLSDAETQALAKVAKLIPATYGARKK